MVSLFLKQKRMNWNNITSEISVRGQSLRYILMAPKPL